MRYAFLLTCLCTAGLHAADPAPAPVPDPAAMQAMSKTGPEHAGLMRMAGTWDVQSTMWMAPDAPPMVSNGVAIFTAELDGKWLEQDYQVDMMGQPYAGKGMSGYDTMEKRYVATWHNTFNTGLTVMTGTSDDGGKTITYTSVLEHCPMTGGRVAARSVHAWVSDDQMTFTMYQAFGDAPEMKTMALVYNRRGE